MEAPNNDEAGDGRASSDPRTSDHGVGGEEQATLRGSPPPVTALVALLLLTMLVGMAARLMELPLNRVIELRYCQDYYAVHNPSHIDRDGNIPEALCKVDAVQQRLGRMQGALATLIAFCDIGVTAPMGFVVDRIGTRLALLLNISALAVLLSWIAAVGKFRTVFPVSAMLAGPFLALYGGGSCVARMAGLKMVTEIAQTDLRLPAYLAYVSSAEYVTSLASPPLSAVLLNQNIWLPFWTGLTLLGTSTPLLLFLPRADRDRSVRLKTTVQEQHSETVPLLASSAEAEVVQGKASPMESIYAFYAGYKALLAQSRAFQLLLATFFVKGLASSTNVLLMQHISKRYHWTFAQVGYLFTFKAAVNVFFLLVVIPGWSRIVRLRMNLTPAQADLIGSKAALVLLTLGATLIAASTTVWMLGMSLAVYASGTVAPVFLYALARSSAVGLMNAENEGKAFAAIVLSNSVGGLLGLPACTAIWIKAIDIGGAGLGLPFYFSATLYGIATIILWRIRFSP